MIRKTIKVTLEQDQWIQAQVAKGDDGSDSENTRHALEESEKYGSKAVEREPLWNDITAKIKSDG